jgi:tellurite resistance protein TerC
VSGLVGWTAFAVVVIGFLALDLGLVNQRARTVSLREASAWCVGWLGLALAFAVVVLLTRGTRAGLEFTTGYLIELSLSVDNLFVFVLLFEYFRVPPQYQHRVLFWGVVGALAMRAVMIGAGVLLVSRVHWILYVFGAFLVYSAIQMARKPSVEIHPETNPVLRLARRLLPISRDYSGERFFVREAGAGAAPGRLTATPLFVVLLVVETTDLVFAVDSIPAILAVTRDPFIVYTSNVFAILGLRSLYFALAAFVDRFHYLRVGLSLVLGFVGLKMLLADLIEIPIGLSLAVVVGTLALSVIASLLRPRPLES